MSDCKLKWYLWFILANAFVLLSILQQFYVVNINKQSFREFSSVAYLVLLLLFLVMGILDKWKWLNFREFKKDKLFAFLIIMEIVLFTFKAYSSLIF